MKKNSYIILGTLLTMITLTSFIKNVYDIELDIPATSTKKVARAGKEDQLLIISQSNNLGMPKIQLHADSIYSSLTFNDGLFTKIPNDFEDKTISFHLPKGYMVVFAENSDGTGESACFVAAKTDVNANLPKRLRNNVSYIRYLTINNPDKKGAANIKDAPVNALNAQWFYGWSLNRSSFTNQQFVPMTWGKTSCADGYVKNLINRKDIDHLLSFNEPDGKGQSNIQDFDTAITRYKIMMKTGFRLGSPATTQDHAFRDGRWLPQFMEKANKEKVRVDYIAVHWYDWGNEKNNKETDEQTAEAIFKRFVGYMEKLHATYPDKPIWLTEFNANVTRKSDAVHEKFMVLATDWMNDQDFVERYAYFFERNHPELNADNSLTTIGALWKSIKSPKSFNANITGDAGTFKIK